jgi:hypothetical protein
MLRTITVRPIRVIPSLGTRGAFELVRELVHLKRPEGLDPEPLDLKQPLLLQLQQDVAAGGDCPFLNRFLSIEANSLIAVHLCQFIHSTVTNRERCFQSLVDLIDPYDRNPHFVQVFLSDLKVKADEASPSGELLPFLEECVKSIPSSGSAELREICRHRTFIKGNEVLTLIFEPVHGIAHTVWSSFAFGTRPVFRILLWFLPFFRRFKFMPALSGLIWSLRSRFSDSPAILGAILRCSSLSTHSGLLPLQEFDFAAQWRSLDIPWAPRSSATAYVQIHTLIAEFVSGYNNFIDSLVPVVNAHRQAGNGLQRLLAAILAPASDIHPHSIIQFTHLERILAGAVARQLDRISIEDTLSQVFEIPCPVCKFVMPKDGKDLFGFSRDEWKTAFSFAPDLPRPLSALTGADFRLASLDHPESHDANYGLLGPILAIYSKADQPELFSESLSVNLYYRCPRHGRGQGKFEIVTFPRSCLSESLLEFLPEVLRIALEEAAGKP